MSDSNRIDGITPYPGARHWDEEDKRKREELALQRRRERKQDKHDKPQPGEPGAKIDDYA